MPAEAEHTNRLRVERRRMGWNQVELAARAGVSQPEISLYERGLIPSSEILVRLGAVFGVPNDTILEWLREPAEEVA